MVDRPAPVCIVLKLPPELVELFVDYFHDLRLKSRAAAIRELLEFALRHAPRHGRNSRSSKREPSSS